MTSPRSTTFNSCEPGYYHCISRCVRQAWLCGDDPGTGRNFDHRRDWVEARLLDLAESFAVALYGWAVMSNHTHVVLRVEPRRPWQWSDEEVARRWARLSRVLTTVPVDARRLDAQTAALLSSPERLELIRSRLGDLSWFMRFLNECIARMANTEDGCRGRFWEGRFKCQALLDEHAVLACMAYVDLNPIRAGVSESLADSDFTSIQRRLERLRTDVRDEAAPLPPLAGESSGAPTDMSEHAYVELVDWTGRMQRKLNAGSISPRTPTALSSLGGSVAWWRTSSAGIERVFGAAVGRAPSLRAFAARTGRAWLRGARLPR